VVRAVGLVDILGGVSRDDVAGDGGVGGEEVEANAVGVRDGRGRGGVGPDLVTLDRVRAGVEAEDENACAVGVGVAAGDDVAVADARPADCVVGYVIDVDTVLFARIPDRGPVES